MFYDKQILAGHMFNTNIDDLIKNVTPFPNVQLCIVLFFFKLRFIQSRTAKSRLGEDTDFLLSQMLTVGLVSL